MKENELWTAWQIYEHAMREFEVYQPYGDSPVIHRVSPTEEQAKEYVDCAKKLYQYMSCQHAEGTERISSEEADALFKRDKEYEEMALDMRDVIFVEEGKKGLRRVTGETIIPALFDDISERYSYITQLYSDMGHAWPVPVVKNQKVALCKPDGNGILLTDFIYDKMFMFFYAEWNYYVVIKDGKKGLINSKGKEVIPCNMDEIYEQTDTEGVIPFRRGDKWGLFFHIATEPMFDDIDIRCEDYCMVRIADEWFYIDYNGKPVKNESEAFFGSWIDSSK